MDDNFNNSSNDNNNLPENVNKEQQHPAESGENKMDSSETQSDAYTEESAAEGETGNSAEKANGSANEAGNSSDYVENEKSYTEVSEGQNTQNQQNQTNEQNNGSNQCGQNPNQQDHSNWQNGSSQWQNQQDHSNWQSGSNQWNQSYNQKNGSSQWNQGYEQNNGQWDQGNGQPNGPWPEPIFVNGHLNRPALKEDARASFRERYGTSLGSTIVPDLITGGAAIIPYAGGFVDIFLAPPLQVGKIRVTNKIARKEETKVSEVFDGFNNYWNVVGTVFLTNLFTVLWGLLLVIPGIYKHYCWYLVPYLLADNPTMDGSTARRLSDQMMEGHKWEAFVLELSFIGWALLGAITLGLFNLFYLNPWLQITLSDYYENLKILEGVDPTSPQDPYHTGGWGQTYDSYYGQNGQNYENDGGINGSNGSGMNGSDGSGMNGSNGFGNY